jgi:hypothetical protein
MPVVGLKRLSAIPSTAGAITRHACAALGEAGFELAPFLARAGLTAQQVDDDHVRISVRSQIKLIELAADALQDGLLGFHLARDFELREMGLLYYALASSEKLGDSLHRRTRIFAVRHGAKGHAHQRCVRTLPLSVDATPHRPAVIVPCAPVQGCLAILQLRCRAPFRPA